MLMHNGQSLGTCRAGSISSGTAAAAITIAGISNTLVKTGIAFLLGTKKIW